VLSLSTDALIRLSLQPLAGDGDNSSLLLGALLTRLVEDGGRAKGKTKVKPFTLVKLGDGKESLAYLKWVSCQVQH
jgi:hypothetical protein